MNTDISRTLAVLLFTITCALADTPASLDRSTALAEARAGHWDKAEPALAALATSEPADVDACLLLAQRRLAQNRKDEAINLVARAGDARPNDAELQVQLADTIGLRIVELQGLEQGQMASRMMTALERALELDPNSVRALMAMAGYYTFAPEIGGGSLERAADYAREVQKRDAAQGEMAFALIALQAGHTDEALKRGRSAAELQPKDARMQTRLGLILARTGRTEEARRAYQSALKLQPDLPQARRGLDALNTRPAPAAK